MPTPAQPQQQHDTIAPPSTDHGPTSDSIDTAARSSPVAPRAGPNRTVTAHRCEALMRSGERCTRDVATAFQDGLWKCPSHRPRAPKDAKPVKLPRPPIRTPKDPSEALQLMGWAAGQAAKGRITRQHAASICDTCREFRLAWNGLADAAALVRRNEALGRHILELLDGYPNFAPRKLAQLKELIDAGNADEPAPAPAPEPEPEQPVAPARGPDGLPLDEDDTP